MTLSSTSGRDSMTGAARSQADPAEIAACSYPPQRVHRYGFRVRHVDGAVGRSLR